MDRLASERNIGLLQLEIVLSGCVWGCRRWEASVLSSNEDLIFPEDEFSGFLHKLHAGGRVEWRMMSV